MQHRHVGTVLLALFAVLLVAMLNPDTADPGEVFWAGMGSTGLVYAGAVWRLRLDVDRWRRQQGLNGFLALTTGPHVFLRGLGVLGQVLILVSGLAAMLTPPVQRNLELGYAVIGGCVMLLGVVLWVSSWYAEQIAERQTDYVLKHPEE